MKTKFFTLAAAAALIVVSCTKAETNNPSEKKNVVKTTINVTTEAITKADFNQDVPGGPYSISWEDGDKVTVVRQLNSDGEASEFTYDGTAFEGSVSPVAGSKWHAFYPSGQFSNLNASAHTIRAELPQNQGGSKSDFNTCYLMYKLNRDADKETPADQESGTTIENVDLSFTLRGLTSVIKLNAPAALNLKTITLTAKDGSDADVYLSGNITLQTAKGDYGLLNAGGGSVRKGNKTSVVVDAGEGTLSGDVYIYLLPDNYIPSGEDRYYYSTARTLNFQFTNSDGFSCSKQVAISAEHPLKGGVLYSFGSLPSSLPWEFDFDLTLSTDGTPILTPANALDGTEFYYTYTTDGTIPADPTTSSSATAPTLLDGRYVKVLGHKDGFADKIKVAYVRRWTFGPDSDFWTNAEAKGITSGTTTTSDISFDTNGLQFSLVAGGKLTVGDGTTGKDYTQFNGKNSSNRPLLDFTPTHNANAFYYLRLAANGTSARKTFLFKDGSQIAEIASDANTSPVSRVYNVGPVTPSTTMQVQIGYNGSRLYKLYWLEWGDNLVNPNPSPTASTETISGTVDYNI